MSCTAVQNGSLIAANLAVGAASDDGSMI